MRPAIAAGVLLALAAGAVGQTSDGEASATGPAGPVSATALAARSLRHSAIEMIHAPADAPGRVGRLIALARFAERLEPDHPRTHWVLTSIHEARGEITQAARSAALHLAGQPRDHARGLLWLRLELATFPDADRRAQFLSDTANRSDLPDPLRAEAAALLAETRLRQGDEEAAREAFEQALQLDPTHPRAVVGRLQLDPPDGIIERMNALQKLLRASPRSWRAIWDIALELGENGFHSSAMGFYQLALRYYTDQTRLEDPPEGLAVAILNAALDTGINERAAQQFDGLRRLFGDNEDVWFLLIEANRRAGNEEKTAQLVTEMDEALAGRKPDAEESPTLARDLAWYHVAIHPQPAEAMRLARIAVEGRPDDPVAQRVLGAAELMSRDEQTVAAGVERLGQVAEKDAYAAALLADYYYAEGRTALGREYLMTGLDQGRSGPAFRRLRDVVLREEIDPAELRVSDEIRDAILDFDERYLAMGQSPGRFVRMTLEPTVETYLPGLPLEVKLTLENVSDLPVPLGAEGLFNPTVAWRVVVEGRRRRTFHDLPLCSLPAPRYLQPGEQVSATARLDLGPLSKQLAVWCLRELTIRVEPVVDPLQQGEQLQSAIPTLAVETLKLARPSLLDAYPIEPSGDWAADYRLVLGYIVRDLKTGPPARRFQAARRIADLLAVVEWIESRQAFLPERQRQAIRKPVLLSMARAVLQDPEEGVRAQMLTELQTVPLTGLMRRIVSPLAEDPAALVRFRLAELLGAAQAGADALADDEDPLVRMMVSAFAGGR